MHRSFDDACRNGVYADAVLGMLNCQERVTASSPPLIMI
jgi:hypothetical protein